MKFHNIIAGGCSFTADGIGGVPPTYVVEGGNSFLSYPMHPAVQPQTWASFIAANIAPKSFINVAGHAHGNIMTAMSIQWIYNHYNYNPANTLVIFNISGPGRMDYACDWSNPYRSGFVPWTNELIPFSYIAPVSNCMKEMIKNQSLEAVEYQTTWALEQLFFWLETHGIKYVFTQMWDYREHFLVGKLIDKYQNRLVSFDQYASMFEFAEQTKMLSADNQHPNQQAHQLMAQHATKKISLLS